MREFVAIVFILICCNRSLSQVIKVTDSNGLPVPFATVEAPKTGKALFADAKGEVNLSGLNTASADTVVFSSIGFKSLKTVRKNMADKIILEQQVKQLPGAVVFDGKWKKELLGTDDKVEKHLFGVIQLLDGPGEQIGRRVLMKKRSGKPVLIEKVSFLYGNAVEPYASVRLRIYKADSIGVPEDDLLHTSLIKSFSEKNGWLEFDLTENPVEMPDNGAIVAVEFFNTDSVYWHKEKVMHVDSATKKFVRDSTGALQLFGQNVLGAHFWRNDESEECMTLERKGGTWRLIKKGNWIPSKENLYSNLVVKVVVKYPKQRK